MYFLIVFLAGSGCKTGINDAPPAPPSDKIKTGPKADAGSYTAGAGSSSITIVKPGTAIDGMTISVPSGAYSSSRNITVSFAPITKQSVSMYFNPISPMITTSDGGGYAEHPIQIKVPVKIPAGYFAMGFFFTEKTGKVEDVPVIAEDSNSITVATRHFATSSVEGTSARSGGISPQDFSVSANLIIASIKESVLAGSAVLSTGFSPGVDDWEFINWGSFIAPGGHCAGQSITSM